MSSDYADSDFDEAMARAAELRAEHVNDGQPWPSGAAEIGPVTPDRYFNGTGCGHCRHDAPHTGGGLGVCLVEGCGCDGSGMTLADAARMLDSTNPKDRAGVLKPQLDLVPAALDIVASLAFADGARKYGPFNWRDRPVKASIYVAAIRRHLAEWFDGENETRDTGVPHLGAIAASVAILADAMANGNLVDDRPTPGPAAELIAGNTKAAS